MLNDFGAWLVGLILLSPIFVLGLTWANISRFYRGRQVQRRRKLFFLAGLLASSVSTWAYLGYWGWRVCELYNVTAPLLALLILDRLIIPSTVLSMAAIPCVLIGRGPNRVLVALATLWLTFQLWTHGRIIHWA